MRNPLPAIRACVPLLLVLYGCDMGDSQKSESHLNSSVHGTRVAYAPNQAFQLELDLNADAGYSWYYTMSDTTVIHLDSTSYRPKSGQWNQDGGKTPVGGMTVETFYFQARKTGECSIALHERQGWLPNVPPIHSVLFSVVVFR